MPKKILQLQQKKYFDVATTPGQLFSRPVPKDIDKDDTYESLSISGNKQVMRVTDKQTDEDGRIIIFSEVM